MGKFTLEDVDQMIDYTIYQSIKKNKIPSTFAMTPDARQYISDALKNGIESNRPDELISGLLAGFIVGYSEGLEDMSEFAEKVYGSYPK